MNIPSPDGFLIDLVDRALAVPQRNGIVLPRILDGFLASAIGMLLVEGAVILGLGMPWLAGLVVMLAAALAWGVGNQRKLYRLHVANWGPDMAARYRTLAAWHRQSMAFVRVFQILCVTLFLSYLLPSLNWSHWALILVTLVPMGTACVLLLSHQYGVCAMPRDPDLRQKTPSLAGQGA